MDYDLIKPLFNGNISDKQMQGINAIIEEAKDMPATQLAYVLATIYHETAKTMQPVKEFGSEAYLKSKPYYPFYGRDLCQTTWQKNYEKVKQFSSIDVVSNPELIGQMPLAAKVAVQFMIHGWYTGRSLAFYFNDNVCDPYNARRIINGTDKAQIITGYWKVFYDGLRK